jgi:hypothetical protein
VAENDRRRNVITNAHYALERNASRIGGGNTTAAERAGSVVYARGGDSTDGKLASRGSAKELALHKSLGEGPTLKGGEKPAEEAAYEIGLIGRRNSNSHGRRESRCAVLENAELGIYRIRRQMDSIRGEGEDARGAGAQKKS